jgi:protein-disulfide isomerase
VSRAHNARRKAKRQAARAAVEEARRSRLTWRGRWSAAAPVLVIVVVLAVVGVLGFGGKDGIDKEQAQREVAALLDGIPQEGSELGSAKAPVTLTVYADLECPTVRLFAENYLPSIIETWVRPGALNLDYRSLETDTSDEEVFFEQETAALAAGRQDKMWNFILTFVREQAEPQTSYVNEEFISDIAAQVPGLSSAEWQKDRADALLSKRVALGVYSGHNNGFSSTPSFLISFPKGPIDQSFKRASISKELKASLDRDLEALQKETSADFPALKSTGSTLLGG